MRLEETIKETYSPITDIDNRIEKANTTVVEVAEISGVNHATIYRWFGKEPETIKKMRRVLAALIVIEKRNFDNENNK